MSLRDTQKGSIFVIKLCEQLQQAVHHKNLYTMLMDVNQRMTEETFNTKDAVVKCSAEVTQNLRFKLYFRPKERWTDYSANHPDE